VTQLKQAKIEKQQKIDQCARKEKNCFKGLNTHTRNAETRMNAQDLRKIKKTYAMISKDQANYLIF